MTPTSLLRALSQLINGKPSLPAMCILALGLMLASPFTSTASAYGLLEITADPALTHEISGDGDGDIEPGESGEIGFRVTNQASQRMHFDGANVWSGDSSYVTGYTYDDSHVWYSGEQRIFYVQFDISQNSCGGEQVEVFLQIYWAIPYHTGDTTGSGTAQIGYSFNINTKTFSYTGPPVAIPDDDESGAFLYLDVSGATTINDLEFIIDGSSCTNTPGATTVGLDHANVHDLVLTLTSPWGTTVTLIDRPGDETNTGSNFCHMVLDDDQLNPSIQSITTGGAPYTGTFAPTNPLSAFIGEDPNGYWTLNVSDRAAGNTGQVNAFTLTITDDSPDCSEYYLLYPSISGHVTTDGMTGVSGVMMKVAGTSVLTDANGYYLSGYWYYHSGSYTVTPYKLGYTFSPVSRYFSVLDTNFTADFIATKANFNISGRVTAPGTTMGLGGITMKLTGDRVRSITTEADGNYTFPNLPAGGNYTVTPSMIGYKFTSASLSYSNLSAHQTNQNFTGKLQNYSIGGIVRLGTARLDGVTVTLSSLAPAGFDTRTATTNSNGVYSFTGLPTGRNYKVTASKTGFQLLPASQSFTNLSANQTAANFDVKVYSISGRVTKPGSTVGISAVTVSLTSPSPAGFAARTAQTNSTGNYTFTNLPAGRSYTLKPTKTGLTFTPATRSITNLHTNIPVGTATSFTGSP